MTAFVPTQATQQAATARRAAAEVRRKLTNFAATGEGDEVSRVEAYAQGDRGRRQSQPQDEEAFREVFVSVHA